MNEYMKKLTILLSGFLFLTLLGSGCSLKPPQTVDDSMIDNTALERENARLKKENDKLMAEKKKLDAMEEKKDDAMTDPEAMKEEDAMMEGSMEKEDAMMEEKMEENGAKRVGDINVSADDSGVVIFLSGSKEDYKGGDEYLAFGCEDYLVPVKVELKKEMSDLAHAIVLLLTTKRATYEDQNLQNAVSGIGLVLDNVAYDGGKRIIEFTGEAKLAGVCDDARIKTQIEETVKFYAEDFEIQLNGSTEAWEKLFDAKGE